MKGRREGLCQFVSGVPTVGFSRPAPQDGDVGENGASEWGTKRVRLDQHTSQRIAIGNGRVDDVRRDEGTSTAPTSTLGRIYIKGNRSRYLSIGDRMAMLDHVSCSARCLMSGTDFYSLKMPGTMS